MGEGRTEQKDAKFTIAIALTINVKIPPATWYIFTDSQVVRCLLGSLKRNCFLCKVPAVYAHVYSLQNIEVSHV